jgi:hypothetical protein
MIRLRIFAMSITWVAISSSVISAQDLSRYREFQLGMSLVAVGEQAGITPEARVRQQPDVMQELMWQPPHRLDSSPPRDSVRKVVLSFSHGQLFRIVVNYEWDRTEGLTVQDMIEALSATYGAATLPATEIISSSSRLSTDRDKIMARWEDPEYSLNLFRPSYASTFGLVFSKRLDALAPASSVEAIRLEPVAPRRASERQQKQEDEDHARQEKIRLVNRATFRP